MSDALVRKGSVKDANAKYVHKLRVSETATDQEIQEALYQLFQSSPQGKSKVTNEDQAPIQDSFEVKPIVIAPTALSKLQLDNSFRNFLYSLLKNEAPYDEIIMELESGRAQVVKNDEIYKQMNGILAVHSHCQDAEYKFWRIAVPNVANTKVKIMQEL